MGKDSQEVDAEPRRSLLSRLKFLLNKSKGDVSPQKLEQEIHGLVDKGEAQGIISQDEGKMIEAVLELGETTAGQIMVPRIDLAMVPETASISETIRVIIESGHSRIPVYSEDPDHIKGVLHAKDLLPYWGDNAKEVRLGEIARDPFFVPQAMPIDELLIAFKRRRVHLAVVVDEYGGTAGVVTMEDVLEEIVGEIEDEYDQEEDLLKEQDDGSLLVDARLEIDDLAEHLEVELPDSLPEGRFETVGGFITTLLGRVPQPEEEVTYGPVRMVIVGAEDRRITQVQVYLNQTPPAPKAD